MIPDSLRFIIFAFVVCGTAMISCNSHSRSGHEPIKLSDSVSVIDMLQLANKVATDGAEGCTFLFSDHTTVTLQFPLLDGDKKHWQFKVIDEIDSRKKYSSTVKTSNAFVVFASCSENGWRLGNISISEADIEQKIRDYANLHNRLVLIIQSDGKMPAKLLRRVWHVAQSAGFRVIIYPL